MWETIKKDPLIKAIVVILIGVLAFGFAFNIMFGAGNSAMEEGSMMSTGYSLGNTLENIIDILVKIVIIALLLGVLVWIIRTVLKQTNNGQENRFAWIKEDPIIKNTLIITGAVVIMIFTSSYLRGFTAFSITALFAFLIKVVIFTFILTLVYGLAMYGIKATGSPDAVAKECPECKGKLKNDWKCCPYCGSDQAFDNTAV